MRRAAALLLLLRGTHALTATGPQPVVWSLAGSDSSAGAGVEADLRAFRCLGARGCAVVTALTAQSTTGVEAVLETPAAHVAATIAALEADLPPAAVKTGALGGAGAARAVAAFLRRAPPGCKVVVDPVVVSTSGRRLLDEAGEAVLVEEILPRADVVCPNAPEAEALLGLPPGSVASPADAAAAATALRARLGCGAVLLKGGHLAGPRAADVWADAAGTLWLAADRTPGLGAGGAHGTGCVLSAALAAALARGEAPRDAAVAAKAVCAAAVRRAAAHAADAPGAGPPPADVPATWPDADAAATFPSAGLEPPLQPFPRLDGPPMTLYALAATAARCAALWDAGVVDVQLRVKDAPPAAIEAEVAAAAEYALARPHARLWVNDHWEAAAGRAGCFGCHLGQEDLAALAPADAARLAASGLRLGVSTHCLAELAVAAALAPTYVALGPVFGTTSKRVPFAPRGLDRVAAWRRLVPADTPLVAIGGVGLDTAPAVVAAGADAVAVISALGGEDGEALRASVGRWGGVWEEGV